ncbi:alpha/beta fold hydrolase [Nocardia macrotermitis]|uniref:Pimeloyl-[acyl-carrier protein] methyl ester esterase n=1 Tax=Nocardia macrotermitis TaxID=2585198 RepID=A0A7K0CVE2_9NOCA|nr:alpha/beta hydrolase [Nocardia macrotermitis]MQY16952.1 Pimeloyl-[acyl-carrier protein] methyl ester esterase [Nocardia macrotermitis]
MGEPTLVLLHGVGLDHTVWEPVAELLADRYTLITPDLPGHGARPPVPAGTTLADLSEGVVGEIPPGSHLVGFSLGALVAQYLALHRPGLAATLTSVSSVCRRTEAERTAVLSRLRTAQVDFEASTAASIDRWYEGTGVDPEWVRRTRETLAGNDIDSFVNCYRVFATADADLAPALGDITVPALAVTGADDPGSTPEMTHRLATALPDCREVIIPNARHMLPVQRPRELVAAITTFIGEHAHV